MKINKLLITLAIGISSTISFAQESKPSFQQSDAANDEQKAQIYNSIKEIVTFNASIVGYAKLCQSGDDKAKSIISHFNNIMGSLNLNQTDSKKLENEFVTVMTDAAKGKNLPAGFQCSIFNSNFNDIYTYIQTGKKPSN